MCTTQSFRATIWELGPQTGNVASSMLKSIAGHPYNVWCISRPSYAPWLRTITWLFALGFSVRMAITHRSILFLRYHFTVCGSCSIACTRYCHTKATLKNWRIDFEIWQYGLEMHCWSYGSGSYNDLDSAFFPKAWMYPAIPVYARLWSAYIVYSSALPSLFAVVFCIKQ